MPNVQKFVLKAEAPIAVLQTRMSGQFGKTLDYLPGTTVRGAFAEIFINRLGTESDLFQRIFVGEEIIFSDFLPNDEKEAPLLLPMTAAACKRYGLNHPDSLHDRLIENMLRGNNGATNPIECRAIESEKICGEPLDRLSGVYMRSLQKAEKVNPSRRLRMHVGISRERGAEAHGQLYSYDMLTEKPAKRGEKPTPLFFIGTLSSEAADAEMLFAAIGDLVAKREHLSIGKARTRGLGEMSFVSHEPFSPTDDFEDRWNAFNKAAPGEETPCRFSITLNSHLILKDKLGRPVLDAIAPKHFDLPETVEITAKFLGKALIAGWNAAQGLPKADFVALSRGSVLGFAAPLADEKIIKKQLKSLEINGRGERCPEGFGRITICHPFHVRYAGGEKK